MADSSSPNSDRQPQVLGDAAQLSGESPQGSSSLLQRLLLAGLFLLALILPSQYAVEFGKAHVAFSDPLILLLGALAVFICFLQGRASYKYLFPNGYHLLFIFTAGLSVVFSQDKMAGVKELLQLIAYFWVLPVIVRVALQGRPKASTLLFTVMGMAWVGVVIVGLFHYIQSSRVDFAVGATFANRNVYGGFLAIVIPICLSFVLMPQCINRSRKILYLMVCVGGLLSMLSGAALLGLILGAGVVALRYGRGPLFLWFACFIIGLGFLLPKLPRANMDVMVQSMQLFNEEVAVEPRYTEWQVAVQMWQEQPWLGVGLGNYQTSIGEYYGYLPDPEGPQEPDRNNLYLVLLSSIGMAGLLAWLAMVFDWCRACLVAFTGSPGVPELSADEGVGGVQARWRIALATGLLGSLVAFSVVNIWTALLVRGLTPMLVFLVCLLMCMSERKSA